MISRIVLFVFLFLAVISCSAPRDIEESNSTRELEGSGLNLDSLISERERGEPIEFEQMEFIPRSEYFIYSLIIKSDTLPLEDLSCRLDTSDVMLTKAFAEFNVSDLCIEMGVEGNTYYSVFINKEGHFENCKVVKGADDCFSDVDEKIKLRIEKMKVISEEFFNAELVFYHKFRLDKV
jgi:hypothetical protein